MRGDFEAGSTGPDLRFAVPDDEQPFNFGPKKTRGLSGETEMGIYTAAVQKLYVAYFSRPADYLGLQYWEGVLAANGGNTAPISAAFSTSAEYVSTYAGMSNSAVVNQVYMNLFGRPASDLAGLTFWSNHLTKGTLTVSNVVTAIAAGAQGADLVAYNNKVAAATSFTTALDTTAEVIGYDGAAANAAAKAWMSGVTTDASRVAATAPTALDASVAVVVGAGAVSGKNYVLQEGAELTQISGSLADRVFGSIDGDNSTLNSGDVIIGNGKTVLRLGVDDVADGVANADVSGVSVVEFVGGTGGTLTFDAGARWDIDTLRIKNSEYGFYVEANGLSVDVDLEIVDGDYNYIRGTFTNDWYVSVGATGDLSFINGNITGVADKSGDLYVYFDAQSSEAADLVIGDVTMSAVGGEGDSATLELYQTDDIGSDITVGNISITGFVDIDVTIENTSHTSDDDVAHSITVGNITLVAGTDASLTISNTGYDQAAIGNVTIGNVSMTVGESGDAYIYIANGFGEDSDDFAIGNTTVGNVTMNLGAYSTGTFELSNEAIGDNVVAGNLAVGNIVLNLGNGATLDFTIDRYVEGDTSTSVGSMTIGDMSVNVGIDASFTGYITNEVDAYSNDASDVSVGLFKMGNLNAIVDDGAYFYLSVDASVYGSDDDISVGSYQFGNSFIQAGADADATYTFDFYAEGDIGSVTRGDVTLVALKDGYVDFNETFDLSTTDADLGSYKAGNITMTAGEIGDVYYSIDFNAYSDSNIGTITLGNVAVNAIGKSASASFSLSATDADIMDIGKITYGNVSVIATGESAWADFNSYVCVDDDIAGGQFGTVTVSANGKNASASFSASFDGNGDVDAVTVGNVALTAIGEGASVDFNLYMTADGTGGTMTVGNIAMVVTATAKKVGTEIDVNIDNSASDGGDIVVGNISLSSVSVRASDDTLMTYDADVYIDADGDLTIGSITVVGGDVDSELNDWSTLSNWLHLTADGTITVGNVDYSGYTGKSSVTGIIDLSSYRGAAVIKGSARKDNIFDTEDTNQIYGGASADKFVFSADNHGKTIATMDKIMDFSYSGGDTIDAGAAGNETEYNEGTFGSFADFVSAANSGDKNYFVGNVTGAGGLIIAVDTDADDAVDYMIQLVGVTSLSNIDLATFV